MSAKPDIFDQIHADRTAAKSPTHPAGKVTGFDEQSGLPIVKRSSSQPAQTDAPKPKEDATEQPKAASPEPVKQAKPVLQPALTKGAKVSLPDGSTAKVAHVIDQKSARVRTEAGRNLVMKQADLTPHVLVKSHYRKLPQ
jgi:sRNA-binding protein